MRNLAVALTPHQQMGGKDIFNKKNLKHRNQSLGLITNSNFVLATDNLLSPHERKMISSIDSYNQSITNNSGSVRRSYVITSPGNVNTNNPNAMRNHDSYDSLRENTFGDRSVFRPLSTEEHYKYADKETRAKFPGSISKQKISQSISQNNDSRASLNYESGSKYRETEAAQSSIVFIDSVRPYYSSVNRVSLEEQLRVTEKCLDDAAKANSKLISENELLKVEKEVLETDLRSSLLKIEELSELISDQKTKNLDLSYINGSLLQELEEAPRKKTLAENNKARLKSLEECLKSCLAHFRNLKMHENGALNSYIVECLEYGLNLLNSNSKETDKNRGAFKEPPDVLNLYADELEQKENKIKRLEQELDAIKLRGDKELVSRVNIECSNYYKSFELVREKLKQLTQKEKFFFSLARKEFDQKLIEATSDKKELEKENSGLQAKIKKLEGNLEEFRREHACEKENKKISILKKTLQKQHKIIENLINIRKKYEEFIEKERNPLPERDRSFTKLNHELTENFTQPDILRERKSFQECDRFRYINTPHPHYNSHVARESIGGGGGGAYPKGFDQKDILKSEISRLDQEIRSIQETLDREMNRVLK